LSCSRNSDRVGNTAGGRAGISQLSSKVVGALGATVAAIQRGLGRAATGTLAVTENFPDPSFESVTTAALVAGAFQGEKTRRRMLALVGAARLGREVGRGAATGLARWSRPPGTAVTEQFFFKSNTPVRLWPSRLTPLLNRRIVAGLGAVKESRGLMLETGGQSWHLGINTVETQRGERILTQLQSLALPAKHYYFNRPLSDNEAVGLISGQKGFEPRQLPGYAGAVSEGEALAPLWAESKKALIRAHLLWGDQREL